MAAVNFPNNPSVNDTHTSSGSTWKWDGTVWQRLGEAGPQGAQGVQGAVGAQGVQGAQGHQGRQGATGAQGSVGIASLTIATSPPSSPDSGDMWWDSDDGDLHLYYNDGNSSQWANINNGPAGAQGAQGVQGAQGAQGHQGVQGASGSNASVANAGNDRVVTSVSGTNLNAEANMQFDGTDLFIPSAIKHLGDPDNHISFSGTDLQLFTTAGSGRMRITDGGVIEMGTSIGMSGHDGNQRLRVGRANDCNLSIRVTGDTTSHTGIDFGDSADDRSGRIQYMHNGDYMSFHTNGAGSGTSNERVRITSNGYIKLSGRNVQGSANGDKLLRIYQPSRTDAEEDVLLLQSYNKSATSSIIIGGGDSSFNAATDISFRTAAINTTSGTERLRIASGGKVGIATDNPYAPLSLRTAPAASNASNLADKGILLHAPGATDEQVIPISASFVTNAHLPRCGIGFISHPTADPIEGYAGEIGFYTHDAADGSAVNPAHERVRITRAGNVGINCTDPDSALEIRSSAGSYTPVLKIANHNTGAYAGAIKFESKHSSTIYETAAIYGYGGSGSSDGMLSFQTRTNERMRIDKDGNVTKNNNPSFAAYRGQSSWSVASGATMVFDNTRHNIGNHYSTSNGRFTAPVAGNYLFTLFIIYTGNYNSAYIRMFKNGSRQYGSDVHFTHSDNSSQWDTTTMNQIFYLSAGDYITILNGNPGVTYHGNHWMQFCGYLLG